MFFFQIKKLSRWEVIDVVRTMSTEQAKAGQEGNQIVSFWNSTGNFSLMPNKIILFLE